MKNIRPDINSFEAVQLMVDTFYQKVQKNDLLGLIFNDQIKDWHKHLATMYSFWQTILLNENTYHGAPFLKHIQLPINKAHFQTWVQLFHENIDEHFKGEKADMAKSKASQLGDIFAAKMEFVNLQKDH